MKESLFSLRGRTALVTGSSRGIGSAITLGFARAGASVAIHHVGQVDRAHEVAEQASALGAKSAVFCGDLVDPEVPGRLVSEVHDVLGPIDILVLNASIQIARSWEAVSLEDFDRQVAVNLRSSLQLVQLVLPSMIRRKWGRLLSIGSVQEAVPNPDMLVYASLKRAQTGLLTGMARGVAAHGITANNLAPGIILTDRNTGRLADEAYARKMLGGVPAGRFGETGDCVGAALLLCSGAGSYITGQNLFVDGGMSL